MFSFIPHTKPIMTVNITLIIIIINEETDAKSIYLVNLRPQS